MTFVARRFVPALAVRSSENYYCSQAAFQLAWYIYVTQVALAGGCLLAYLTTQQKKRVKSLFLWQRQPPFDQSDGGDDGACGRARAHLARGSLGRLLDSTHHCQQN